MDLTEKIFYGSIILIVGIVSFIIMGSTTTPDNTPYKINCSVVNSKINIKRCENHEVVCYTNGFRSISCKFKRRD